MRAVLFGGYGQPVETSALPLAQQLIDALRELAGRVGGSTQLYVLALQSSNSFPACLQGCAFLPIHHADLLPQPERGPIYLMNVRTRSFPG